MKYLFCLSLCLLATGAFAQSKNNEPMGIDPNVIPGTETKAPPKKPDVFMYVEQMPIAGYDLNAWIGKNMHMPQSAIDNNINGRVITQFVVDENGVITDPQIIRGLSPACDAEALRLISTMPAWKPGKQNGKAVKVRFTQPIVFRVGN